ncbi:hypothetical protein ACLE20_04005 [Rhizobium sp. YIM 134829]|uniref:hypothetical protein n=1 Tax=Rhizobium sp. YIM 134829 TaxID=3390453 RepID=UPI00397D10EF
MLRALARRLTLSRALMEHQLWEAVRLLDEAGRLATDLRHEPGFRQAMEARRFGAAVAMLADSCGLAASIEEQPGGIPPDRPSGKGEDAHRDPQAAALLRLLRAACRPGNALKQDVKEAHDGPSQ